MESTAPISLKLEIQPGADPIEGRIVDGRGSGVDFTGWIGLARALDEVLSFTPEVSEEDLR